MTDAPIADYPLVVMLADKGKAYYSDEIMAVYRLNLASISHQRTLDAELYNRIKKIYTELDKQFDYKYHKELMVGLKGHKIMQIEQKIRRAVRKKAYLSIFSGFAHLFLIHRHSQYSTRDLLWILRRFVRTGNYLLIFITSLNIYRTAITILPGKV